MRTVITYFALFLSAFVAFSCADPDIDRNVEPAEVIKIITPDTIGSANGASAVQVKVRISNKATPSRRSVVFTTSAGFFADSKTSSTTVEANSNFTATASLVSTAVGKAEVTATAGNVKSNSLLVDFTRAYPISVTVSVDSFAIANQQGSELTITARMRSDNGVPSVGHPVSFSVYDSTGTRALGAFLNNVSTSASDGNGVSRIRYSPGGVNYQGYLRITATTLKADNTSITASTRVFLYRR